MLPEAAAAAAQPEASLPSIMEVSGQSACSLPRGGRHLDWERGWTLFHLSSATGSGLLLIECSIYLVSVRLEASGKAPPPSSQKPLLADIANGQRASCQKPALTKACEKHWTEWTLSSGFQDDHWTQDCQTPNPVNIPIPYQAYHCLLPLQRKPLSQSSCRCFS